jgi:alkanesulfonate monooxygenase SsuD/methylene tetrahydromethanopterin reductase-like flavin-dependent oxidoreductase (luciferase family)
VIAGVNVIAADTNDDAQRQQLEVSRRRIARFVTSGRDLTDDKADELLRSPQGEQIAQMMHYTAAGDPELVATYLDNFAREVGVDELMTVHPSSTADERLRSIDLLAETNNPVTT